MANEKKLLPLPRKFFARDSQIVAKDLLGKLLVRKLNDKYLVGKIVEVESYLGEYDPAAHVSKGKTKRTEIIYGRAGHAYIYTIHGHKALNVVCETVNSPGSVLIRALEPIDNISLPTNGPGRLTKALHIDSNLYGVDLTDKDSQLIVCEGEKIAESSIVTTTRIGVKAAEDWLLRFVVGDSKYISR